MKTYKSHKEVKADEIIGVTVLGKTVTLHTGEPPIGTSYDFDTTHGIFARTNVDSLEDLVGWFLVQYADGYQSLSPAKAFKEGYHPAPAPKLTADAIEAEIVANGLTAPRITPDDINATIDKAEYSEMKTYKCHKEVKAAEIVDVCFIDFGPEQPGQVNLHLDSGETKSYFADHDLFKRYNHDWPRLIDFYLVEYADGYQSLSPAKAFKEGYHPAPVPRMDANSIEVEIQAKGLVAPRITPDMIDEAVRKAEFHVFAGTTLTVCVLTLWNGFTVTGESACASPENFDKELGEKIAMQNAKQKIWALEGYRLRSHLHGMFKGPSAAPGGSAALAHKESVASLS